MTCSEAGHKGAITRHREQRDRYRFKAIRMALAAGRDDQAETLLALRGRG